MSEASVQAGARHRGRPPGRSRGTAVAATLLAAVLGGCAMSVHERALDPAAHPEGDILVTRDQLRLRLRGLVGPFCGEVEAAADDIAAGCGDAAVRRQALEWKVAAVPALRAALFQPDPLTALADTWVLLFQMTADLEAGSSARALGPGAVQAAAACRRLEGELTGILASFTRSGDVSRLQALARDWAARHPLRRSVADREPVPGDAFGRELAASLSIGEAADQAADMLDDMSRRLEIYSRQVPRLARWETERMAGDVIAALPTDRVMAMSDRAVTAAEDAARAAERLAPSIETVIEHAPRMLAAERVAAIQALHGELQTGLAFLQDERIASIEALSHERVISMGELRAIVAEERTAATRDIARLSKQLVDDTIARVTRLAALVGVAAIAATLALLLLARWLFPVCRRCRHAVHPVDPRNDHERSTT